MGRVYDKNVQPGETLGCELKWRNDGQAAFAPRFRLDIKKSGISTWNEGIWTDAGEVAPGQTVDIDARIQIPSNWNHDASPITARLGVEAGSHFGMTDFLFWYDIMILKAEVGWIAIVDSALYHEE